MSKLVFDNLSALQKHINEAIADALGNEVAEEIKQTESEVIDRVVYHFAPSLYVRRTNGGLGDTSNMSAEVTGGFLVVKNLTPPNPDYRHTKLNSPYIASAVEFGERYDFWRDSYPRPFTAETAKALQTNKNHIKALRRGLRRKGINA